MNKRRTFDNQIVFYKKVKGSRVETFLALIKKRMKKIRNKLDRVSILRDPETARVEFFTDKPASSV